MTVQNQTITAGPYSGNSVADSFTYTWTIQDESEVVVIETDDLGVETVLTVNVNYRVGNVQESGGGTITRVVDGVDTPLPVGYSWFIRSNFVPTQETDFDSQGAFFPENHEFALDKLTRLIQQLLYQDTLTLSFSEATNILNFNPQLPPPTPALSYLRVNAAGTGLEWVLGNGLDTTGDFNFTGDTFQYNSSTVITEATLPGFAAAPVSDATQTIDLPLTAQSVGLVTTNANSINVTIQPNATITFPVGAVVPVYQAGTGTVTMVAGAGVTLEYDASESLVMGAQYGFLTAWQRAVDVWVITGKLAAAA